MPNRDDELAHIEALLKQDAINDEEIESYYLEATAAIVALIESFYGRHATGEGLTLNDARMPATSQEIEQYQQRVEHIMNQDEIDIDGYAERLESGNTQRPSSDNLLTERARRELDRTNINRRSSRLDVLNANMRLEAIAAASDTQLLMEGNLNNQIQLEGHRQYQLMGEPERLMIEGGRQPSMIEGRRQPLQLPGSQGQLALPEGSPVLRIEDRVSTLTHKPFYGRQWSTRLWSDQSALAQELERLISRGLANGLNPRQLARELRQSIDATVYNSERLLRTELARAQGDTFLESAKEMGLEQYEWVAEYDACPECAALDGQIFRVDDAAAGYNFIPKHPHCRCGIAIILVEEVA